MPGGTAGPTLRSSSDVRIGVATFSVYTNPEDTRRSITILQADPLVEIADQILERADPEFLSVGDGIVTFHCQNGDVSYGLREHDDLMQTWLGIRSDISQDDLLA